MDVVVLAAGKNERLEGVVAPYHKPLIVLNGRPLIKSLVIDAYTTFLHREKELRPSIDGASAVCYLVPSRPWS